MSLNLTSAAALQAYVQDFAPDLISKLYVQNKTSEYVTFHEGVKGNLVITDIVLEDLVRRYSKTFTVTAGTHTHSPRILSVADAKIDLKIYPKDYESTYLGRFRKKGQDDLDLPFEGYIMNQRIAKVAQEIEMAQWRGVASLAPAGTDKLNALFNGYAKIIDNNLASLAPVTTGALTAANAYTAIESVYMTIGSQYQDAGVEIFISPRTYQLAIQQYRASYGFHVARPDGQPGFDLANNATFAVVPGMPDNRIFITPKENLHYGIDGTMDSSMFKFEQEDRAIKMWMDFKIGTQIGFIDPEILGVNIVA